MRRAAGSRAGRTGASPAGWSRRPWRAAAPSIASPRRRRRAPASGSSCGAAGPSTPRRRHEACARHPRASGSRRHAARAQNPRRRGSAPRLGAPLRARRPACAGGEGGSRRRARHLPAGAPALACVAGAARAARGRAAPRAPRARRRRPLRLHAVELPVLSPRRVARARVAGGARLLELRRRRGLPQAPSRPGAARDRALGRLARARAPGARRVRARDAGPRGLQRHGRGAHPARGRGAPAGGHGAGRRSDGRHGRTPRRPQEPRPPDRRHGGGARGSAGRAGSPGRGLPRSGLRAERARAGPDPRPRGRGRRDGLSPEPVSDRRAARRARPPGAARSLPARPPRGHGARAPDRGERGGWHPRDAGGRRERVPRPARRCPRARGGDRGAPPRSRAARAPGRGGARAPDDPLLARGLRGGHVRRLRRRGGGGMSPRVSVIVPTFNRAHVLGESVASLLAERDVDLEVVVVDDGSTDATAALLAGLGDRRVRAVIRPHAGIAAARNAGIAAARAPYVAFHDSDDLALPGRLSVPLAFLAAYPEVDLVIQNGRMLPPEDDPEGREEPWIKPSVARALATRPIGVAEVFRWNLGQLQGMCFTRRALDATGPLDPSFTILDDLDLVLRVTLRFRAVFLDVPAFAYRRHAAGVARDRERIREEAIRLAEKLVREHPEALDRLGRRVFVRRQARRWGRLATARLRAGDPRGARAALAEARALHPGNVAYRLRALWLALRRREWGCGSPSCTAG